MQIKNKMREAAKKLAVPGFDPHLSKGANHKAKSWSARGWVGAGSPLCASPVALRHEGWGWGGWGEAG